MIIYQITNKINGDCYIGKTSKTIEERFQRHIYNSNYNIDTHLCRAMRKYGADNYSIEILESQVSVKNIDAREKYYIETIKPRYNMTEGGDGGDTSTSPNFRRSMKEYHSRKPRHEYATCGMSGKKQSQKWRDSIKKSNSRSVSVEGVVYTSITEAEAKHPGVKVRYRIDSDNYPDWFRIK